ncbi:DNA polymerase III subunit delta [Pseudidiomarina mangrovi]|uniref:DNA polymerase III subunit delta n=1 Tax=Pseudidiomarina mangrovi TaxID=2487133 RepID=UPI000FCA73CF|nr:DNA polymerase III subunit delta [Pseudidiomarina mangrovi]CAI8163026.1 MAG: DNA polymerase III subunit delta [Pseudidiomarina mangrovi]
MQLSAAQLPQYLQQHGLPPLLCIFGDTPLLLDDSLQMLRQFAKQQGVDEREYHRQDAQFDWRMLSQPSNNLSLFSSHRLLELELPEGKPGREGGDALRSYAEQPVADQTLVIIGPKLKGEQLKAKWFLQLQANAPIVEANSPERRQLPRFIAERAQRYQLQLDNVALQLMADWYEGNLLALDQELQKLALMDLPQPLDQQAIRVASADQSRFSVFALQEALVAGQTEQALHRLQRLFEDDAEIAILNWMLQREWQKLCRLESAMQSGESLSRVYPQLQIWRQQEQAYQQFLARMQGGNQLAQAADLLRRIELAFKRDSGEQLRTLVTHLVCLYCQPSVAHLHAQLCYDSY